jgi:hypothetical protein
VESSGHPARSAKARAALLFALIVAFGAWLRLDQIADQIIAGDEWHSLAAVCYASYRWIGQHFGMADHCIPMTLFDKLLSNTVGLSELGMRALPLAAGIGALVLLPAVVRPRFGARTALLFAALLAISPVHVHFSRFARPYAVLFLLGLLGAFAFERFLVTGERRLAWLYAGCAIVVPWFHPILLPFMLAPLGFALLLAFTGGAERSARVRALWPCAAAIVVGWTILLGPPLLADFASLRERSGLGRFETRLFGLGYDLVSGTERPATRLLFAVLVAVGSWSWWTRRRATLAYFGFMVASQTSAIALSKPVLLGIPMTAVRYGLPLVGIVLLLAAEGLSRIDGWLHAQSRDRIPRHLAATLGCLAFLAWSPVISPLAPGNAIYFRSNSWTNNPLYQGQYAEKARRQFLAGALHPRRISKFYRNLAQRSPGDGASTRRIVEAPWHFDMIGLPFVAYQRVHRWPVVIGFVHEPGGPTPVGELPWPDARFRFRNFVDLADFEGLAERRVEYVVLHKDLAAEAAPRIDRPAQASLSPTIARYTERFGPPCFEDVDLIVFDVSPRPLTGLRPEAMRSTLPAHPQEPTKEPR